MSVLETNSWKAVLSRLNSLLLQSEGWRGYLRPDRITSGWCGSPCASENEILDMERRLGISLPPSYRSFLLISNGWRPFNSFVERLLPAQTIERFRIAYPEDLESIQRYYKEDDVPDSDYLDYETPKHRVALRHRYYPECVVIGEGWTGGGELVLLNPHVISADGEWKTISFGDWLPGNWRYRSFREYFEESVNTLEKIEAP